MTLEAWLALAVLLQQQPARCIAREDRKFLAEIVNTLVLDEPPEIEEWQRRWLLALKRECRL